MLRYYPANLIPAVLSALTPTTPMTAEDLIGWWRANATKLSAVFRYVVEHQGCLEADLVRDATPDPASNQPPVGYLLGLTAKDIHLALVIGNQIALAQLSTAVVPCIAVEAPA